MKRKASITRGLAAVMAFLMLLTISASTLMFEYAGAINSALNVSTSEIITVDDGTEVDTAYYTSEFGTDYTNKQSALKLEMAVAAENVLQAEEGTVLLRNENAALPLAAGSQVTIFGNGSYNSNSSTSSITSIPTMTFNSAMQKVLGAENVNTTLADNVYSKLSKTTNTEVIEAPISDVKAYESSWQSGYNDAALVVLTRVGGESNDNALYGADGNHMLGLSTNEEALMSYLKEQKDAGVFGKIVVVINSEAMMELGWLADYGVDACLLCGDPGAVGFEGVANVIVGKVNPSGHTVDTYAVNSLSAPAVTYAGDNTQMWGNVDEVNATCTDTTNDGREIDYYVIYAEGIYVGYKYYETRYEDVVMGNGNASSAVGSSTGSGWNYADEVAYTFGYGLSYTTFDQVLQGVEYDADSDNYLVTVQVTNTGSVAGKSVVQVYAQTPYGDYEKQNNVEKAAVNLLGFGKTDILEPGESETVTVPVERYFLASYDSKGAQGYILSAGDYYLSIGDNAHDALNNILAAKGYTTADGMDYDGTAAKTHTWNQAELDTESYNLSRFTGVEVTNQFDHADLSYYGIDFTYLSRNDWEGTYPAEAVVVDATDEMMEDLNLDWYETPADAPSVDSFTQGAENGLSFIDMRLVDYDDDETWNSFLDQFTVEEMAALLPDTFGVAGIDRLGIPAQGRTDDCRSSGTLTATGENALTWVSEPTTARTWNTDLCTSRGRYLALETAFCGLNEIWYGAGNLHRTPFGGRNHQYVSEDGNLSYIVTSYEAAAMQENGINYAVKHFVLNDQESHRESLATFTNEQALREIYLRVCEGAFCEGGANSVMTAFNRLGVIYAATDKALLTDLLRGEWGFEGHITTDGFSKSSLYKTHYEEMFDAGLTFFCLDPGETAAAMLSFIEAGDGYMLQCLRQMTKHNIYAAVNSVSVNGLSSNSIVVTVVPWWQTAMLAATAVFALGFVVCTVICVVSICKDKKRTAVREG